MVCVAMGDKYHSKIVHLHPMIHEFLVPITAGPIPRENCQGEAEPETQNGRLVNTDQ